MAKEYIFLKQIVNHFSDINPPIKQIELYDFFVQLRLWPSTEADFFTFTLRGTAYKAYYNPRSGYLMRITRWDQAVF